MPRRLLFAAVVVLTAACSPVKNKYVRPNYNEQAEQQVQRVVVITQPLPAGQQNLGDLWSLIARQWINQNSDFIVRSNLAQPNRPGDLSFSDLCVDGIEGVLWLDPVVQRIGDDVEAAAKARLIRCADDQDEWRAEASGRWSSSDEGFRERTAEYVEAFGPGVAPYVVPSYKLLRALFETLPNPELTDEDLEEKIELGE